MATKIPQVRIGRENYEMLKQESLLRPRILGACKAVMEYFRKEVVINFMHGEVTTEAAPSGTIAINLWSSTESDVLFPEEDRAFGYKFCTDAVFTQGNGSIPYGDHIPLIQYLPDLNRIDFLYDVCEFHTEDEIQLFKKLLTELLYVIAGGKEKFEEAVSSYKEYIGKLKQNAIVNNVVANERNKNESRKERIRANMERIKSLRAEARSLIISVETDKELVNAAGSIIDKIAEKINSEFDIIRANSKVDYIDIDERGYLNIFTKQLYSNVLCDDKKIRRYRFGAYRINVNIGNGEVRFYNMNKADTRKGYWTENDPHPHVSGRNGQGCLGSAAALIADTIDQYQWGALADILINYLESVNLADGAGKGFYKWQEVNKDNNPVDLKNKYIPGYGGREYIEPIMTGDYDVWHIDNGDDD